MTVTENIANYVKEKAVNLSAMSRATGVPYSSIYGSLADKSRNRPFTVDEAISICKFLGVDPMDFAESREE